MGYIPKPLLKKAYLTLSNLTEDHRQGQTQIVSAIRYVVALDMFYNSEGRNCNLNNASDRDAFTSNVRFVVNINEDNYTANFHTTIESLEDCRVGSNFYSAGVVAKSKVNPSSFFDYPTRGSSPLFRVKNNTLYWEKGYLENIQNYIPNDLFKSALVLWLLRNEYLDDLSLEEISGTLLTILSEDLTTELIPNTQTFCKFIEGYSLDEIQPQLSPSDFLQMLNKETIRKPIITGDESVVTVNSAKGNDKYRPYITAIKSKPFLLLAGISGTGKSRIVRELARACWDTNSAEYKAQKPRNFEMVQVKPNWHDSSELIGYVSRIDGVRYVVGPFLRFMVKAIQDPETPYFLCLDEMNLAPVEQYFAEYLSVIESRKRQEDGTITTDPIVDYSNTDEYYSLISQLFPDDEETKAEYLTEKGGKRLSIPQNLIVVGTVNMDETTFSFSRKVLDRAMTIEMNEVNLRGGLVDRNEKIGKLGKNELVGTYAEGVDVYSAYKEVCRTAIKYLESINGELEGTPFKIAYRTRNEVLLYVVNNLPYNKDKDGNELDENYVVARALDEITNMKILSRIEGDETKVGNLLDRLTATIAEHLREVSGKEISSKRDEPDKYYSVSFAKLEEMKKRLDGGFTSFWS